MICRKTEEELQILRRIPKLLGRYFIWTLPELVYFSSPGKRPEPNTRGQTDFMRYLDFFVPCLCVDRDYAGDEAGRTAQDGVC